MKKCSCCKVLKELQDFSKNRSQKDGFANQCRPCKLAATNKYKDANPDSNRNSNLRYSYGISNSDYIRMLISQDGKCAACDEPASSTLFVDHDHSSGKIRSLLCRYCNTAIGMLKDSSMNADKAASYLRRHGK